jgi:hypothetical protein
VVAAPALLTSVIGTLAVMHALGYTFNIITMLTLTPSIGLLFDDAIVVIENIDPARRGRRRPGGGRPQCSVAMSGAPASASAAPSSRRSAASRPTISSGRHRHSLGLGPTSPDPQPPRGPGA